MMRGAPLIPLVPTGWYRSVTCGLYPLWSGGHEQNFDHHTRRIHHEKTHRKSASYSGIMFYAAAHGGAGVGRRMGRQHRHCFCRRHRHGERSLSYRRRRTACISGKRGQQGPAVRKFLFCSDRGHWFGQSWLDADRKFLFWCTIWRHRLSSVCRKSWRQRTYHFQHFHRNRKRSAGIRCIWPVWCDRWQDQQLESGRHHNLRYSKERFRLYNRIGRRTRWLCQRSDWELSCGKSEHDDEYAGQWHGGSLLDRWSCGCSGRKSAYRGMQRLRQNYWKVR